MTVIRKLELTHFIEDPYKFVKARPNSHMRYLLIPLGWTFQGLLYADKSERYFKILIDIFFVIIFCLLFVDITKNLLGLALAFFFAHTLNWLFNSGFWGPFRGKYGFFINGLVVSPQTNHIRNLQKRVKRQDSIECVAIYGSISRNENTEISDLDVRIIRKPGIINAFYACTFGLFERANAFLNRFPLDLYVLDGTNHLSKIRSDEVPIVLHDPDKVLEKLYYGKVRYINLTDV